MDFDKAYDKLSWVREQLESTVSNSRVDLMPSDMGDFFITVTQRNETTGNDNTWSFCVNVDDNYVQMLEPTEDEEKFTDITEVLSIVKSFLQGGMSRDKRRNMPEYNPGEPIKITGKGNKIDSSNKTVVRQGPNLKTLDETPAEHIMKNLDAYKGYTKYDMEQLVLNPSGYTLYDGNNRKAVYKKDGAEDITLLFRNGELRNAEIKSSRKSIKSGYVIKVTETDNDNTYSPTYVNGDSWQSKEPQIFETEEDAQEQADDFRKYLDKRLRSLGGRWQYKLEIVKSSRKPIKSSAEPTKYDYNFFYNKLKDSPYFEEYVVQYNDDAGEDNIHTKKDVLLTARMPDGKVTIDNEKASLVFAQSGWTLSIGRWYDTGSYSEIGDVTIIDDRMSLKLANGQELDFDFTGKGINSSKKPIKSSAEPTKQDYIDFVNQLNAFVAENYETHPKYGPLYVFKMYEDNTMNSDSYKNEYPNLIIYDDEGNLDMHTDDSITEHIRQELEAKGWYPECVHSLSDFTIAVI